MCNRGEISTIVSPEMGKPVVMVGQPQGFNRRCSATRGPPLAPTSICPKLTLLRLKSRSRVGEFTYPGDRVRPFRALSVISSLRRRTFHLHYPLRLLPHLFAQDYSRTRQPNVSPYVTP